MVLRLEVESRERVREVEADWAAAEAELVARQQRELANLQEEQSREEERILVEIRKLEQELERLQVPAQLVASLTGSDAVTTRPAAARAELGELELELQCCSCSVVCRPPSKIFQCPEVGSTRYTPCNRSLSRT